MDTIRVKRDGERDLKFVGERIASASSKDSDGSPGRWCELELYRTESGKYVAVEIGRTIWDGEHDRHSATICEGEEAVVEALGTGWLAKELYSEAGIDCTETVD